MNWEALGTLAEVVAALAVIVSLIYLARQIGAQIKESQLTAAHEIAAGFRDMLVPFMDPDFAELLVRANNDFDGLSDSERFQIIVAQQRNIRLWEEAYYQYKGGRLNENIWHSMVRQYSSFLSLHSFAKVWELRREFYNADFVDFVEGLERLEYKTK
ncbi:MAG: hypothetical protein ACU84Q_01515 [Gammaproteobacteria bacterium]